MTSLLVQLKKRSWLYDRAPDDNEVPSLVVYWETVEKAVVGVINQIKELENNDMEKSWNYNGGFLDGLNWMRNKVLALLEGSKE